MIRGRRRVKGDVSDERSRVEKRQAGVSKRGRESNTKMAIQAKRVLLLYRYDWFNECRIVNFHQLLITNEFYGVNLNFCKKHLPKSKFLV